MTGLPALGAFFVVTRGRSWTARLIERVTGSPAYHAGTYVGPQDFTFRGNRYHNEPAVFEGRPGGAGFAPASQYPDAIWSDVAVPLTATQGAHIVAAALGLYGTRYGWLNCFCIGLTRLFHWHANRFMRRVLASKRWAECAQLVDIEYRMAGVPLFHDDRPAGLVSPADLLDLILTAKAAA